MVSQARPIRAPVRPPPHRPTSQELATQWVGDVTCVQTPALRDILYAALETLSGAAIKLDVTGVTAIDATGVALLIGVNNRAAGMGRRFVLIDKGGPVSRELMRRHLIQHFNVTQVVSA